MFDSPIKVGTVGKPHGIAGEVVVRAATGWTADDLAYDFLLLCLDGALVPFAVDDIRLRNDDEALVKFALVGSQEEAKRLTDAEVFIDRSWQDEDDLDERKTGSLVGYTAIDENAGPLGRITSIDEQGGNNPLFVVDHDGDELLIPITDDFISEIDDERCEILFNLPEGLISI